MDTINRLQISGMMERYKVHIFVFFLTLFISLTLAHPSILLNDEFITTNQVRQLHAGHQIVINEGKYGLLENGSMSGYFSYKSNVLAYPLFLPLLSLPAYWVIDFSGEHFVFIVLILWTITAIVLTLFIHHNFQNFSYIGRWQWTPLMLGAVFVLFFINLFFYTSFPVDDIFSNFPEIIAIVVTNIILLSFCAVMIYEIIRTIFKDLSFSLFGTLICLFSSSSFFWATFCKDHILVLTIFTGIFLCLVRYQETNDLWYFPLSFLLCGTLAWVRPELALWLVILTGGIWGYTLIRHWSKIQLYRNSFLFFSSPFFTLIGALPFFLNNYFITKNFFLPPQSKYLPETLAELSVNSPQSVLHVAGVKTPQSLFMMFVPSVPASPMEYLVDIKGIFFYPQNGSISVIAIIPLALVMIVLAGPLLSVKRIWFHEREKKFIILMFLMSSVVFPAYAGFIHILNTDSGVSPDIRYFIPIYLPLTILGLIVLKRTHLFPDDLKKIIGELTVIAVSGLVITVFMLPICYSQYFQLMRGFLPLGKFFSLFTFFLVILTLGMTLVSTILKYGTAITRYLILLLCSVPLFWQVNLTIMLSKYSLHTGYIFWIPVVNEIWNFMLIISAVFT